MVPQYMTDMFTYVKEKHSVGLRSVTNECLYLNKPKTGLMLKSFSYGGAAIWNQLPTGVKASTSFAMFKRKCSEYSSEYLFSLRET